MQNKKIYNAGIIGLGRIGFLFMFDKKREQPASHSAALSTNKRIKLICGCDIDKEKLEKWGKVFPNAKTYDSYIKMLQENSDLDVLVISVDEYNHLKIFKEIVKYNIKLIILEKPVGRNFDETEEIIELTKKYNLKVLINHERRFSDNYLYVKNIIKNKTYGDIVLINGKVLTKLAAFKHNGIGSVLKDSSHLIDIINFLTDGKSEILLALSNHNYSGVHVSGKINTDNKNNIIVSLDIGYTIQPFVFEIDIIMDKGRIIIGNGYLKIFKSEISPFYDNMFSLIEEKNVPVFDKTNYFVNMVNNVIDYPDGNNSLYYEIYDAYNSLECIDKITKLVFNYNS